MRWYFSFFFVSGFCSILYEVIWLRLTMAQFGVTTALVSVVLAVFMVGLGLGSWGSGYLIRRYERRINFPALRLYAATELLISISAVIVPYQLFLGRELLQQTFSHISSSSSGYYSLAAVWVAISLVPWCACMGATFPFAMLAIKNHFGAGGGQSFSYLYLANVSGAVAGATVPLLLIELLGFRSTLLVGAALNCLLGSCAFALTLGRSRNATIKSAPEPDVRIAPVTRGTGRELLWFLLGTGLTSMGVEVVWIRLYTPSLGTMVYAFAAILALYLAATYLGSWVYRRQRERLSFESHLLWTLLGFSLLLPLLTADPRVPLPALLRVILGVAPLSALVGFVTPLIIDRYSQGDPELAGSAYAMNIVGCVVGPLLAGFVLLPLMGERLALCSFALPWFLVGFIFASRFARRNESFRSVVLPSLVVVASLLLAVFTEGYEQQYWPREVRRDHTATVVATGQSRIGKRLLINGVGITQLSPVTKMMAHLPLALLRQSPENALVICFGMGTTHRSVLSWQIQSTAVELVPSVPGLFSFFHPDGLTVLDSPRSRVVIDDGRFYIERSTEKYDAIIIDPPPPVEAAASSLLYSKEFYAVARLHLRSGGILQQWLPQGDPATRASVARALKESFPYIRAFGSVEGWGTHFLASMSPIRSASAIELAQRLPAAAAYDLMEWGPSSTPEEQFRVVLDHEVSLTSIIEQDPMAPALQDDRPINEYFLIRRLRDPTFREKVRQRLFGRTGSL